MIRAIPILIAGCVAAERVDLPEEASRHQSMIFAVTSGSALRVTAHSLPLDRPIDRWTASGPVTFVAFFHDEPLDALGLEEGELADLAGGDPIPLGSSLLINRELSGWMPALADQLPPAVDR